MTHTGGLNPLSLLCMADVGGDGARRTGGMKGAAAAAAAAATTTARRKGEKSGGGMTTNNIEYLWQQVKPALAYVPARLTPTDLTASTTASTPVVWTAVGF